MGDFFGSIWWFIVALGLLVSFHEFGHFWVARRMGVKVLRFSIGFGRPLWLRRGQDGTEYAIASIPLGGYVKMLDEREGPVDEAELDRAFNRKSLSARTAIVAAGPVFNLIFAVLAFWVMFMIGMPEYRPVFGAPEGIAQSAGMRDGDLVLSVDDRPTETMTQAGMELLTYAIDGEPVGITVERLNGGTETLRLPLDRLGDFDQERLLEELGLNPWEPQIDPVVGEVAVGRPAEQAGFRPGDRILAVGDQDIDSWYELGQSIQEQTVPGRPLRFEVERGDERLVLNAVPERATEDDPYVIGISWDEVRGKAVSDRLFTLQHYGPVTAFGKAFGETRRLTVKTLQLLGRMVSGSASLKMISGPISIARYANDNAQMGLARFLFFLGVLSLSLAILNFLPVPLLDGGHLLYYLIEWVKGSPLSERAQIIGQYIGLTALAGLVSLSFYNDILRLLT